MEKIQLNNISYQKNTHKKNIEECNEEKKVFDIQKFRANKPKDRAYKYFLEGGVIKLYLVEGGIKKECIKTIPLKDADPSILAQVENLSPADMIMIVEMQQNEKKKNDNNEMLCDLHSPRMSLPNMWKFPNGKVEENEKI
ncbi:hypothetical protein [Clostridium ganghwense]|uniref:Uncharacterized protein n=1 Tax=Clostridium ganghwense TaxID=312089 RepID=A0ABT4CMN8_9CLOT|nr:hypothetical protein [Clostridium ganghwense]MCY6369361.1 hypothetical protein [Clostridium ganghwense]